MSVFNDPHLRDQIRADRRRLQSACQRRGISVREYKLVKAVTQLGAVASGIYAMTLGADPMHVFSLVAAIWLGPEYIENKLANGED